MGNEVELSSTEGPVRARVSQHGNTREPIYLVTPVSWPASWSYCDAYRAVKLACEDGRLVVS